MRTYTSSKAVEEVGMLADLLLKGVKERDAGVVGVGQRGSQMLGDSRGNSEVDIEEVVGERDKAMAQFAEMAELLEKAEEQNESLETELHTVKLRLRHHEQQAAARQREISRLTAELTAQKALQNLPPLPAPCASCADKDTAIVSAEQEIDSLVAQNETLLEQLELQLQ